MIARAVVRPQNTGGMDDHRVKPVFHAIEHGLRCLRLCFGVAARNGKRGERFYLTQHMQLILFGNGMHGAYINEARHAVFHAERAEVFRTVYVDIVHVF